MNEHPLAEIERDVRVPAAPDQVWEVVIAPGWLADEVELELLPGGEARFDEKTGWVEHATPPADDPEGVGRLIFWWGSDGEAATRVELTLEPNGDTATRLRVIESRPLEVLDATGIPLPGSNRQFPGGGPTYGPAMVLAR